MSTTPAPAAPSTAGAPAVSKEAMPPLELDESCTVVSAPGKVMIVGGYMVLERENTGLSFAVSARFRTAVTPYPEGEGPGVRCREINPTKKQHLIPIRVESPQFHTTNEYLFCVEEITIANPRVPKEHQHQASLTALVPPVAHRPNPFVEIALQTALNFALWLDCRGVLKRLGEQRGLRIRLQADNSFYSQHNRLRAHDLPLDRSGMQKLEPFLPPTADAETRIAKTGLGSSAGLVSSLVGGILQHSGVAILPSMPRPSGSDDAPPKLPPILEEGAWDPEQMSGDAAVDIAHLLSQYAHCLAQGKIGSGFDVASACYGSIVYRRFQARVLQPAFSFPPTTAHIGDRFRDTLVRFGGSAPASLGSLCHAVVAPIVMESVLMQPCGVPDDVTPHLHERSGPPEPRLLDHTTAPLSLPRGMTLVLGDVAGGSHTPSMVSKVTNWRKTPAAEPVVDRLCAANVGVQQAMAELGSFKKSNPEEYEEAILKMIEVGVEEGAAEVDGEDGVVAEILKIAAHTRSQFLEVRRHLRLMGDGAIVPVEPRAQGELVDATMDIPGVLFAGVPGAGGYDAVFTVAINRPEVLKKINDLWVSWDKVEGRASVCTLDVDPAVGGILVHEPAELIPSH